MGEKAECLKKQQKDENERIFLFNLAVRNAAIDVTQTFKVIKEKIETVN